MCIRDREGGGSVFETAPSCIGVSFCVGAVTGSGMQLFWCCGCWCSFIVCVHAGHWKSSSDSIVCILDTCTHASYSQQTLLGKVFPFVDSFSDFLPPQRKKVCSGLLKAWCAEHFFNHFNLFLWSRVTFRLYSRFEFYFPYGLLLVLVGTAYTCNTVARSLVWRPNILLQDVCLLLKKACSTCGRI